MKKVFTLLLLCVCMVGSVACKVGSVACKETQDNNITVDKDKVSNNEAYLSFLSYQQEKADSGDADAQLNLGMMYGTGTGVPEDHLKAKYYFNYPPSKVMQKHNIILA